ncbi:glutamyl-tRNA reductase [Candidatus Bathyarchaeota archaeon A05DMB-2]|jgi:glutamyl-tRNA reductase|nr:glutamyl-tRNA reductase [Candidatus Bathyarchaeota archaeon A05DMB-2]
MHSSAKDINIVNVRITHKTARVPLIEAVAFRDMRSALKAIRSMDNVEECVLLQTCNRIELYIVSEKGEKVAEMAKDLLAKKAGAMAEEASKAIECSLNGDALRHILRLTSGLESMVIGEDQILNQVWDAYLEAESAKTAGIILKHLFMRAMSVGRRVRKETDINKGAVSVGSAAVELAESLLGKLDQKKVLVMGAGEMGTLVAKALARRCLKPIFIANRTYARAVKLAEELSGSAVKFDKLEEALVDADVVICSTAAPHYLLTKDLVAKLMKQRQNKNDLIMIDISNPRNVEKATQEVEKVKLYDIDDLQLIAEKNKRKRQRSMEKASKIIDEELILLNRDIKIQTVRDIVSFLFSRAEEIRQKELAKALKMLGDVDEREKKIIEDLTFILLKQTYAPIVENLRSAAKDDDKKLIEVAIKLFGMEPS